MLKLINMYIFLKLDKKSDVFGLFKNNPYQQLNAKSCTKFDILDK